MAPLRAIDGARLIMQGLHQMLVIVTLHRCGIFGCFDFALGMARPSG